MSSTDTHLRELGRLLAFIGALIGLVALTYVVPGAEAARPWLASEPVPLIRFFHQAGQVAEDAQGELGASAHEEGAGDTGEVVPEDEPDPLAELRAAIPTRGPTHFTAIDGPEGALDAWFEELARAEAGETGVVVRALHWGDSTIAGDGITQTVRARLQARFGDGGPGFLSVQVDPRWAVRPNVTRVAKGDWETLTIIFGGAENARYGLAGTVSTAMATAESTSFLANRKVDDVRALNHRFEVWYQTQPGGGSFWAKPRGAAGKGRSTDTEHNIDRIVEFDVPEGSEGLGLGTKGDGPVTVYGAVLETAGPGVTWESFGVAGAGQGSMMRQSRRHLSGQIAQRDPKLLVYMTGGNELSYPSLDGDGSKYRDSYTRVLERLKAGAPEASCLVITPLDQAERYRGEVRSKLNLDKMVALQREAAVGAGCAFWNARGAMGGDGAFARWLAHEPPLAWSDLMHLSDEGLEYVGHSLADALELAYDGWRLGQPDLPPRRADDSPTPLESSPSP